MHVRVLWITNTIFPAPSKELGLAAPIFGGWMYGLAESISNIKGIHLAIATIYSGKELKQFKFKEVEYFLLPCNNPNSYNKALEKYWKSVYECFKPDLVHIHGTEYVHGLACMRALPEIKYLISIQGLLSVYAKYYYSGLTVAEIVKNITIRDLIKKDTIFQQKQKFERRGVYEKEYLRRTNHVIGRTNWDAVHSIAVNSEINYHFCNELLRKSFYQSQKWSLENCEYQTIFLSQASYPIKGLHQVINAIALLKEEFPNIKVKVGGPNIIKSSCLKEKIKISGYGSYIKSLLKKEKLERNFVFLGNLSEEQMINEYLRAHIFICPSSIENSPNSLGEAQMLGVPSISSYAGGVPNMIEHEKDGLLYRFEEVEMLGACIRRIFKSESLSLQLSKNAIISAELRHNLKINVDQTIAIYSKVISQHTNNGCTDIHDSIVELPK